MKKIIFALSACVLSTPIFAATTTSSIPMSVEIAKQCSFSNVATAIILKEDGSATTAGYSVTCNTPYSIFTDNAKWNGGWNSYISNAQGEQLKTGVSTTALQDGVLLPIHAGSRLNRPGYSVDDYVISFAVTDPITPTTRAGVYTDTYLVDVEY